MQDNVMEVPSMARLRSKKITKLTAISLAIMALMVQLFAGVLPGEANQALAQTASDRDHIITGGFKDKNHLLSMYDANRDRSGHTDIQAIYKQYGITRADIVNSQTANFNTNDFNGQLSVIGRTNHNVPQRHPVKIEGTNTTIYDGGWLGGYNDKKWTYKALVGKRASDGKWFALMYDCGNIVYVKQPPVAKCESVTVQKLNRTHVRVAAKASTSGGAKINDYRFVILKDGKEVNKRTVTVNATGAYIEYDTARDGGNGTYTAKVGVNTSEGYKTSPSCEKTFTVEPEEVKTIKVCELETRKVITINEKDFDAEKHSKNLDDCKVVVPVEQKNIEVCELATKEVITIKESEFDAEKHSKDMKDCEETPVVVPVEKNIEVCELATKDIVTIKESEYDTTLHSKDMDDCKEEPVAPVTTTPTPTAPPELPRTGVVDGISGLLGLGSMIAAAGYYLSSRRNLLTTMLNR